jgi:hypothetical protein
MRVYLRVAVSYFLLQMDLVFAFRGFPFPIFSLFRPSWFERLGPILQLYAMYLNLKIQFSLLIMCLFLCNFPVGLIVECVNPYQLNLPQLTKFMVG